MTTGYNVVDSCVLFSFSHSLRFFSYLRAVSLRFLYFVSFFRSNFMFLLCFSFEMVSSEQILGLMTVGRSVGPLHSMSRPNVYDLPFSGISPSRFN